jgi:hypothetical protein
MFRDDMKEMCYRTNRWPKARRAGIGAAGFCVVLIAALVTGCASSEKEKPPGSEGAASGVPELRPPAFLDGAVALLLTNGAGFRAHVVLTGAAAAEPGEVVAGELLGRRGKLLFAPEPGGKAAKRTRKEDFSFIWDVDAGRGFVLNGPLQGYAPITANTPFTNLVVIEVRSDVAPQQVAGHPCQESEVKVAWNDGTVTVLRVWRAMDLQGLPLRITCATGGAPLILSLSKVRQETPPNDLFLPPDGFTKYASAEAMMTELMVRQQNHKRKPDYERPPSDEIGNRDARAPTRSQ